MERQQVEVRAEFIQQGLFVAAAHHIHFSIPSGAGSRKTASIWTRPRYPTVSGFPCMSRRGKEYSKSYFQAVRGYAGPPTTTSRPRPNAECWWTLPLHRLAVRLYYGVG